MAKKQRDISSVDNGKAKVVENGEMVEFKSGARRSKVMPRYDLLPAVFLKRVAARFEMGLKYGEHNYKKGLLFDDTLNHIIDHLLAYRERRKELLRQAFEADKPITDVELVARVNESATDGDDLAGAGWGIAAIMYLEDNGRLL